MIEENTWGSLVASMTIGESKYHPVTLKMSSRVIEKIEKELSSEFPFRKYSVSLFTCVSAKVAGDVRYAMVIDRVE